MSVATYQLNGKLEIKEAQRPSFGSFVFDWFLYILVNYLLQVTPLTYFGIFLKYLTLFIAIRTTIEILFTPKYYSVYIPNEEKQKESSQISDVKPDSENQSTQIPKVKLEDESKKPELRFCPQCGTKNDVAAQFCATCGTNLSR